MAYGRTFLQLINDVLRELREPEVTDWNETDYSTMIGAFVNSCKRDAENAWTWSDLRNSYSVATAADTITYALTGTDGRARVLDAWNTTTQEELRQKTWRQMNAVYFGTEPDQEGNVTHYISNGVSTAAGEFQVDVWPTPNSVQALVFNVYAPQLDLDSNSDVMLVPHRPVVEGTLARARFERGEDGGVSFEGQSAFMARSLSDHIAMEANRHPEDLMWEPI
jgi:hypothetical protein